MTTAGFAGRPRPRAFSTALMHVLTGSMNEASSKLILSGIATMPRSATHGIARAYWANPPPLGQQIPP